jgi:hypothetical protein
MLQTSVILMKTQAHIIINVVTLQPIDGTVCYTLVLLQSLWHFVSLPLKNSLKQSLTDKTSLNCALSIKHRTILADRFTI